MQDNKNKFFESLLSLILVKRKINNDCKIELSDYFSKVFYCLECEIDAGVFKNKKYWEGALFQIKKMVEELCKKGKIVEAEKIVNILLDNISKDQLKPEELLSKNLKVYYE